MKRDYFSIGLFLFLSIVCFIGACGEFIAGYTEWLKGDYLVCFMANIFMLWLLHLTKKTVNFAIDNHQHPDNKNLKELP